eukprot:3812462-Rhodomonas_salina.1
MPGADIYCDEPPGRMVRCSALWLGSQRRKMGSILPNALRLRAALTMGTPAPRWKATRVKPMRVLASCVCAPTTELPSGSCVEEDKEEEEEEEEGHIEQATRRRRRVENSISAEEGQRKVAAQASNKKANGANKRGLRRKKTKNAGKGLPHHLPLYT